MLVLSVVFLVALAALVITLAAAYMIHAERFEVTSHIWKIMSLSIKLESPRKYDKK